MRFLNDPEAQQGYKNTKPLSSCAASDYSAIFYVGGHGPGIFLKYQLLIFSVRFDGQRYLYFSRRTDVERGKTS